MLRDTAVEGTSPDAVPVSAAMLRRVASRVFDKPRPYTTVCLGGLDLMLGVLRGAGRHVEADRLTTAAQPLVDSSGATGVLDLASTLGTRNGKPSKTIAGAIRNDELESALANAFQVLGWEEFLPMLATWSPNANRAVDGVELPPAAVLDRRELVLALARRVREIEAAWEATPEIWNIAPMPVDGRTLKAASKVIGLSVDGRPSSTSAVDMAARHSNRIGRAMAALALSKLPSAMNGHAPSATVRRAVAVLTAVAEAVTLRSPEAKLSSHGLRVPSAGVPVVPNSWSPASWWPVLDAWGSQSRHVQDMIDTSWKLPAADADLAVWAVGYATALMGVCADLRPGRVTDRQWADHVVMTLDPIWALRVESVWDLFQSTRLASTRAPFPSSYGSVCAFSRVDFGDPQTLPWIPDRDE